MTEGSLVPLCPFVSVVSGVMAMALVTPEGYVGAIPIRRLFIFFTPRPNLSYMIRVSPGTFLF